MLVAMNSLGDPIARAFELAKSGRWSTVGAIKKQLRVEGYGTATIEGKSLNRQLSDLIKEAKGLLA